MKKNFELQCLRGYAATLVVFDHALLSLSHHTAVQTVEVTPLEHLAWKMGSIGVNAFFVISGFIMMSISWNRFRSAGATKHFYGDRVRRVVPLYYVASALYVISRYGAAREIPTRLHFLTSFFFLPYPYSQDPMLQPVLGLGWTLNYEMFFYFLFGLTLFFTRGRAFVLLCSLFGGLVSLGIILRATLSVATLSMAPVKFLLFYTSPEMLFFVAGMGLAVIARSRSNSWPKLPQPAGIAAVLVGAWIALSYFLGAEVSRVMGGAIDSVLAISAVALCVLTVSPTRNMPAEKLGDASYSVYLFHLLFLGAISVVVGHYHVPNVLRVLLASVAGLTGGYLCYLFLERPITRALHRPKPEPTERLSPAA